MAWTPAFIVLALVSPVSRGAQGTGSWDRGTWVSDPAGSGHTTHGGTTGQCAASLADRATLANLQAALGCTSLSCSWLATWFPLNTTSGPCPCVDQWHGVECDVHGAIVGLDLSYNGLAGTITGDVASLPQLRTLKLNSNAISGTLPHEVAYLTNLKRLYLQNNELAKESTYNMFTVPEAVANLQSLEYVFVDNE